MQSSLAQRVGVFFHVTGDIFVLRYVLEFVIMFK